MKKLETEMAISEQLLLDFHLLRRLARDIIKETRTFAKFGDLTDSPIFREDFDLAQEIKKYEIKLIKHALKLSDGSQAKATKLLGIKATTLNNKIKTYKIMEPDN